MHMFEGHITKHLREGEDVIETIRQSALSYVWHWVASTILLLLPFFFLLPLVRAGSWGVYVALGVFIIGGVLLWRWLFMWSMNVFVLTRDRLVDIDQHGFFTTVVSSANYEKIQDVSFEIRGFAQTIFRLGTVSVQTAGSDVRLELHGIHGPQRVQERITSLVQKHSVGPVRESAERLATILENLPRPPQSPSVVKPRPNKESPPDD